MTLETCKRLLKHYEDLANGVIEAPNGHKHWDLVVAQAKVNAEAMRERIEKKTARYKKEGRIVEEKPKESKEKKEDGKKSTR